MMKDYLEKIAYKIASEINEGNTVTDTYIYELIKLYIEQEHLENEITSITTTYRQNEKPKLKENQLILNELISLISYSNLEEYKIKNTNSGIEYTPNSKKIILDIESLKSISFPTILTERSQKEIYRYLYVTQKIIKAMTYCLLSREKQSKKAINLQEKILELSYKEYIRALKQQNKSEKQIEKILLHDDIYLENKNSAPEERFSLLSSYNAITGIMDFLNIPPEIESTILLESYQTLIAPYTSSSAPTCTYLEKLGYKSKEINKLIAEGMKKDDQERFELGLAISNQMYHTLSKIEENLKRKLHLTTR